VALARSLLSRQEVCIVIVMRYLAGMALAASLISVAARAEDTVGAILDAGAAKLSADEFKAQFTGRSATGKHAKGTYRHEFLADGKLGGSVSGPLGTAPLGGTWKVDDNAQVCLDYVYGIRKYPAKSCHYYFKNGDQYWEARSDSDREVPAGTVQLK
jgi:hypothetical protein